MDLTAVKDWLSQELFDALGYKLTPLRLILIVFGPFAVLAICRMFKRLLRKLMNRAPDADAGVTNAVVTVGYYIALLVGYSVLLAVLGFDLTSIAIFSGALGVGIGLGLQDLAKNFIGGLILIFTRPIKPGDRVEIEGRVGDVRRISTYSTMIQLLDGSMLVLPNSMVLNGDVVNWNFQGAWKSFDVTFRVPFDAPDSEVESVMLAAATTHPEVSQDPEPAVRMNAFTESGIEFSLWVTVHDVRSWVRVKSELNNTILSEFRQRGWGFGIPLRRVTSTNANDPT
jgi:potassium-dependent mechanosensitive channel